ncbi:group II intron maturase-specific domain-containing protein [Stutzerimonas stutzeri]
MPVLRGWIAYFKLAETKQALEELETGSGANCAASCGGSGNTPILAPRT